jgi:hypothetical protein
MIFQLIIALVFVFYILPLVVYVALVLGADYIQHRLSRTPDRRPKEGSQGR